jgi:N-acetylmuramoyl-L-alanine amidase
MGALVLCVLLLAFVGVAQARTFGDVAPEDWFATAVDALSNNGVIDGYGDGNFHPYETVTRAQFASMLARSLNPPQAWTAPFTDIGQADWYYGSVASLYGAGLVAGLTSSSFGPDQGIQRAQVATMIMRALTYRLSQAPQPGIALHMTGAEVEQWLGAFRDRWFISAPHDANVALAMRLGIVTGQDDGRYYPLFTVTRAQAAGIVYRALYQPLSVGTAPPVSVPAEEGYGYLSMGSQGQLVTIIEQRLAALKYQVGEVDGYFDERTETAVTAFQKAEGLSRTGEVGSEVWMRIAAAQMVVPRYDRAGVHAEVDLTRQILILADGMTVLKVLNCSTGKPGWDTPPGNFSIQWKVPGWRQSTLGFLYKPSYFYDGMAIHGGYTIMVYPSSHGCVRIHNWEADEIYDQLPEGTPVDIYF